MELYVADSRELEKKYWPPLSHDQITETMIMRIIRLKDVISTTGLSRSTIYKYIKENTFPKPVDLGGRAVGWVEEEVTDWVLTRIEMRDSEEENQTA